MARPAKSPHRTQNRITETFSEKIGTYHSTEFNNEPNTDWSLAANRRWAEDIRRKWEKTPDDSPIEIPLVVAGENIFKSRRKKGVQDPSQFNHPVVVARSALATGKDIDRAVATAKADPDGWRKKTHRQRHLVLSKVAVELRRARGDLIGAAAADTGKMFTEADVDFIILTGGTHTGLAILDQRPDVFLAAETGGKNATIVTALADRDQAISNIIYSAFGNSGQKCSATSLLILEPEVYRDAGFRKHLVDAACSVGTGSAWDFANKIA